MEKCRFISMLVLLLPVSILLMLSGCDIEINFNSEKQAAEKMIEKEEQDVNLLKDEISIDGIKLYDSVGAVENKLGEPDRIMEEPGNYSYDYGEIGISLIFDKETDEIKGIMIEGGHVKTERGIGILDEFDEILGRYHTFSPQGFGRNAVIVHDDRAILSFMLDGKNGVSLISLMDTEFYEKASGMSLEKYIAEIERVANGTSAGGKQEVFEIEYEQQNEPYEEIETDVEQEQSQDLNAAEEELVENSGIIEPNEPIVKYATSEEEMHLYAALIDGKPSRAIDLLDEYQFDLNYLFSPSEHPSPYFQTTFIHSAAEYSTLEVVQKMIEHGADPETMNPDGYPVLFIAIKENKTEIAEYLLEWGSNPDYLGYDKSERNMSNSSTPLMLAAEQGNIPLIEQLIYRGVDINQQNDVGETALMFAVYNDQLNAAQTLTALGADILIEENTYHHTIFGIPDTNSGLSDKMVEWLVSLEAEQF